MIKGQRIPIIFKMAAQGGPPAMPPLELTDDERAVLRECRVNSIYFRGIPLGAISVLIMREGLKTGYLSHIKRFSGFYYPGLFAMGFLAGIASYRKTCMDKILRLENSQLADQVRQFYKKAGMPYPIPGEESSFSADDQYQSQSETAFHDEMPKSSTAVSRDNTASGSNTSWTRPSPLGLSDDETKQSDRFTSYEELRRRNRNQWMNAGQHPPVSSQRPQVEEGERYRESEDYRSPTESYQTEISSLSWSEDDTPTQGPTREDREDEKNLRTRRQRGGQSGPAPMKNRYGDSLDK